MIQKLNKTQCWSFLRNWHENVRLYSVWPDYYSEPVHDKSKLIEIKKSGEADKLSTVPIKSAKSENTCSVFHDDDISKFTNYVMRKGKKELARSLVEKTFENIKRIQLKKYYKIQDEEIRKEIDINPQVIFHKAIKNCTPILQLTPIKRGGQTYQVPVPISPNRARFLAMNWLIQVCKDAPKPAFFQDTLALELLDAANNTGKVVKKKIELHKQCEANRAYAHYRWG